MLVVKRLILKEQLESEDYMRNYQRHTLEQLTLRYGAVLNGIRYDHVEFQVHPDNRNDKYDTYVLTHQARAGFYEYMKAVDDRNERLGDSPNLTKTIEEVREIARGNTEEVNDGE